MGFPEQQADITITENGDKRRYTFCQANQPRTDLAISLSYSEYKVQNNTITYFSNDTQTLFVKLVIGELPDSQESTIPVIDMRCNQSNSAHQDVAESSCEETEEGDEEEEEEESVGEEDDVTLVIALGASLAVVAVILIVVVIVYCITKR